MLTSWNVTFPRIENSFHFRKNRETDLIRRESGERTALISSSRSDECTNFYSSLSYTVLPKLHKISEGIWWKLLPLGLEKLHNVCFFSASYWIYNCMLLYIVNVFRRSILVALHHCFCNGALHCKYCDQRFTSKYCTICLWGSKPVKGEHLRRHFHLQIIFKKSDPAYEPFLWPQIPLHELKVFVLQGIFNELFH